MIYNASYHIQGECIFKIDVNTISLGYYCISCLLGSHFSRCDVCIDVSFGYIGYIGYITTG